MEEGAKQRFAELKAGGLLPSPRGVAMTIVELSADPDARLADITRLVQADPAMSGRILRYANAVHGGSLRHIVSLPNAITFLGLFRVRQVALAFSLIDNYRSGSCPAFGYFGYWTTSLATGIAAQRLAAQAQCPPDESFTCGLLSGIGRLGLATVFPQEYAEVLDASPDGAALTDAERVRFGIDHVQLSAEMLSGWGLPEVFTEAVRFHERPAEAPFSPDTRAYMLTASLHLAVRIGKVLNLDESRRWERVPALFHAAAQLGLEAGEVPPLVDDVAARWQEWGKELQLPTRSHANLLALLAAPAGTADDEAALAIGPLHVLLMTGTAPGSPELAATLAALGLRVHRVADWEEAHRLLAQRPPDLLFLDLGDAGAEALDRLRRLRAAAGSTAHVIVLIAPAAEGRIADVLLAGASDYLTHDYTEGALIARLANAQQMVSLRGAVQAEWHLAIRSSGAWARANRRLLREALTDALTQLPNRRYGLDRFGHEWAIAESNGLPMACMMLDIDHFKRVNDERGHEVGDVVLRQVAAALEHSCRRSDILFRYGGEEFCCVCPNTALAETVQLAERIVRTVRQGRYGLAGNSFGITVSAGVAVRSSLTPAPGDLIARADQALYQAKEQGRDRVVANAS